MKKSLLLVLAAILSGSLFADNVSLTSAQQVGAYFFTVATGAKAPVSAEKLDLAQQLDNPTLCVPALYCFNVADNGFVVVSGSDDVEPILAYSPEGRIDPDHINPAAQWMLDEYARLISFCQNEALAIAKSNPDIQAKWDELFNESFSCDLSKSGVLIQDKWGQGSPDNPTYNICCPTINGKHCIAGCGPVAMSMIVHYWKYPVKGSGLTALSWNNQTVSFNFNADSNKFRYDDMVAKLRSNSPYSDKHAIGKLMFACGVVMKARWGLSGTSVTREHLQDGMNKYFLYDPELTYYERDNCRLSDEQWIALLHENIDSNLRPVYYAGHDVDPNNTGRDAGHAFVLCGSSATDVNKFFVNWGWDGGSNGFFTFNPAADIASAGGYCFTSNHGMLDALHPIESVGIDELTQFDETPVYPNPASEYVMIPAYDLSNNALLSVFATDGKMVDKAVIPAHSAEYRLNLRGYAPGTYFYRLNGKAVKFIVK